MEKEKYSKKEIDMSIEDIQKMMLMGMSRRDKRRVSKKKKLKVKRL